MVRRVILCLCFVVLILVGGVVLSTFWLAGRPLAAPSSRQATVFDSPYHGDLIPLPSTDIHGITRHLTVVEVPPLNRRQGRQSIDAVITRAEESSTPPLRRTLNCLLVGLDRRPGMHRGGRTDTLVIAVFDRASDHIGLVSIPRDLYVVVPDHGPTRINAVWSIAGRQGRNGLETLERVVEDTLAIPIHHSLAIDLGLFERSVDALGGVTVDVRCPIQDNFIDTREESGRLALDVAAGRQHMSGRTAAMYARSRHGRSDWDRARRQQAVLFGMRDRLLSLGGVGRLPSLWDEFGSSVTTEMTRLEIFRLAVRALQADGRHIHGLVIGYRQTRAWVTPEGRWVLLPEFEAIDDALSGLFSAPTPGARPSAAECPAADVALTRPNRQAARRRMHALRRAIEEGNGG